MAGFFAHNGRGGARHGGHASPFAVPGSTRASMLRFRPQDRAKPLSAAEPDETMPRLLLIACELLA
jgi:hypothetical protein